MFRVMCIKKIDNPEVGKENAPRPSVGDVDTVIRQAWCYGGYYYALERFGNNNGYAAECFAILSDQPEEVIEETELATA